MIRRDVELAGMMKVIVSRVHDLARLIEVPIVRVMEIVTMDDERQVLLEQDFVHLSHMRDGVQVGVSVWYLRLVRVVRVVAHEGLPDGGRNRHSLPRDLRLRRGLPFPTRDEGEVRRVRPARPDVQSVRRGVPPERLFARAHQIQRALGHDPQVLRLVGGRRDRALVKSLRRPVDGERRDRPGTGAETADLVRVGRRGPRIGGADGPCVGSTDGRSRIDDRPRVGRRRRRPDLAGATRCASPTTDCSSDEQASKQTYAACHQSLPPTPGTVLIDDQTDKGRRHTSTGVRATASSDSGSRQTAMAHRTRATNLVRMATKDDVKKVPPTDTPQSSEDAQGHPEVAGATALGAATAGMAGAAIGTAIAGPVGGIVGAAVGSAAGGLGANALEHRINPTIEDSYWRKTHQERPYYESNLTYDEHWRPAYRHGWEARMMHGGRQWEEVEPDLEKSWAQR